MFAVGEILVKIMYISVGPGCRNYVNKGSIVGIGDTIRHWTAGQVRNMKHIPLEDRQPLP